MGEILGRFTGFERALLVAALVAALAAVGVLGRGDGIASLLLCLVVAGACVGAAGGSRKRRLMGDRRQLGPIEELEHTYPLAFVIASGAVLALLLTANNGPLIGIAYFGLWVGLQLAADRL